jgi:hypothetical protein
MGFKWELKGLKDNGFTHINDGTNLFTKFEKASIKQY